MKTKHFGLESVKVQGTEYKILAGALGIVLEDLPVGQGKTVPGLITWGLVITLSTDPGAWDDFEELMGLTVDLEVSTSEGRTFAGEGVISELADVVLIEGSGQLEGFDRAEFDED